MRHCKRKLASTIAGLDRVHRLYLSFSSLCASSATVAWPGQKINVAAFIVRPVWSLALAVLYNLL